jgi:hypothetical protein
MLLIIYIIPPRTYQLIIESQLIHNSKVIFKLNILKPKFNLIFFWKEHPWEIHDIYLFQGLIPCWKR